MSNKIKVLCTTSYVEGYDSRKREIWTKGHTYECKEKKGLRAPIYEVETNMQQNGFMDDGRSLTEREFLNHFELVEEKEREE